MLALFVVGREAHFSLHDAVLHSFAPPSGAVIPRRSGPQGVETHACLVQQLAEFHDR